MKGWQSLLGAALLGVACTQLLTDKGNAFPCDVRANDSAQCAPGEVCNVNGVCQRFQYEGPQFEGPASLPVFDGGALIHPLVLRESAAQTTSALNDSSTVGWVKAGGSSFLIHEHSGAMRAVPQVPAESEQLVFDSQAVVFAMYQQAVGEAQRVGLVRADGTLVAAGETPAQPTNVGLSLRVASNQDDGSPVVGVLRANVSAPASFGMLLRSGFGVPQVTYGVLSTDAGETVEPLDMRWVLRRPQFFPLFLAADGFYGRAAPWVPGPLTVDKLNSEAFGPLPPQSVALAKPLLRHDSTGSMWAASYVHLEQFADGGVNPARAPAHALSVWTMSREGNAVSLKRLWNDCAPCPSGVIVGFTPTVSNAGAAVDVWCAIADQGFSLTRVVGSLAVDPSRACQASTLPAPFALSEVSRFKKRGDLLSRPVVDQTQGDRLTVGGVHGQVWSGTSLGALKPVFLDRTPFAVGEVTVPSDAGFALGGSRLTALTEVGVFADYSQNGLARVDVNAFSQVTLGDDVTVQGVLGGRQGWFLLSTGDVARFAESAGDGGNAALGLTFGPTLLTARGDRAQGPYFGEALTGLDGGVLSLVASADDSLYFLPSPKSTVVPGQLGNAVPVLTPEPSSPIRSLAIERSALATNGVDRLRGYLVTARNLYAFSMSGTPIRGNAEPIVLGTGEPVEVWMDNPRGGLGRVGYRDGEIFTLPGGFKLVEPLLADGGTRLQVVDYENLGGWPVALTNDGLYVAYWEQTTTPDGKLELVNKDLSGNLTLPMPWHEVTLAGGAAPWKGRPSRLFVREGPVEFLTPTSSLRDGGPVSQPTRQRFTLYAFVGEAVYEVGTLTRSNNDVVKQ
ncbi:MAG: hypothetical protein K1X64_02360 [Myxococcaceae bacterium]|nr:hypothetical protein [Myxococcaceae bacterium]